MGDGVVDGVELTAVGESLNGSITSGRSLNSEILVVLVQVVAATPPDPRALLARADALRGKLRVSPLTDARLRAAKAQGRR